MGAGELDPLLIVQRRDITAKGNEKRYTEEDQDAITGRIIVRILKLELAKVAAEVEANPSKGIEGPVGGEAEEERDPHHARAVPRHDRT